jgi:hypothetical protein
MRDDRLFHRVVLWSLVAAIGLPSSPAAAGGGPGQWSKVEALNPDTRVVVTFVKSASSSRPGSEPQEAVDGYIVRAGADALTLSGYRSKGADAKAPGTTPRVTIPRGQIVEVAVVKDGRPWWAIPLFVAALAAGIAVCVGVAVGVAQNPDLLSGVESDTLGPFAILAVLAVPVIMVISAGDKIDNRRPSVKVIYRAPRPAGSAGQ